LLADYDRSLIVNNSEDLATKPNDYCCNLGIWKKINLAKRLFDYCDILNIPSQADREDWLNYYQNNTVLGNEEG
jgi:hypothetical protein